MELHGCSAACWDPTRKPKLGINFCQAPFIQIHEPQLARISPGPRPNKGRQDGGVVLEETARAEGKGLANERTDEVKLVPNKTLWQGVLH